MDPSNDPYHSYNARYTSDVTAFPPKDVTREWQIGGSRGGGCNEVFSSNDWMGDGVLRRTLQYGPDDERFRYSDVTETYDSYNHQFQLSPQQVPSSDKNPFISQLHTPAVPAGLLQWEAQAEALRSEKIWNAYLYGQSANVAKAAVWWSMFGTLVATLLSADQAVGISRAAFNVALVLTSPLAGAVAERSSIRRLLNVTTFSRMLIWSFLVPLSWIVFNNILSMRNIFWPFFVFLMFVDGIQVAFANVVDIDCGGLETLSLQYNLPVNDYIRNRFNSIHQMVFDLSFILFTPPVAFLILEFSRIVPDIPHTSWLGHQPGVASLQLGISSIFLILSILSMGWYCTGLPKQPIAMPYTSGYGYDAEDEFGTSSDTGGPKVEDNNGFTKSVWAETRDRIKDVMDGFRIVLVEKCLGWRLVFLALETALEDSMVSVVIPEIALHTAGIFAMPKDSAVSNVWAVCIIATGKVGGLIAGLYMSSTWTPPIHHCRDGAYRILFRCVLVSSLSVSLLPISRYVVDTKLVHPFVGGCLVFFGSFLFFVFSTAPKIGFATLLQSLVANQQLAGRVFGFVGTFVTIADALIILLINFIFVWCGPNRQQYALVLVALVYLIHGLFEALAGPRLVLEKSSQSSSNIHQPFPIAAISDKFSHFRDEVDHGRDPLDSRHKVKGVMLVVENDSNSD